ncbi:hypothetical protein ACTD5D_40245 [Nocardia takedensis]|uniref:hypothetical protein n=1 Tax=Nocardia takedensis TaxID=259390 RepID=UPI003F763782
MTTYRIGLPSELKSELQRILPRREGATLGVLVTPRDRAERRCPAYAADHYEVQAFYTRSNHEAMNLLEQALDSLPGVYLTTQVRRSDRNTVTNPAWPESLGTRRRGFHDLRPQVLALIKDRPTDRR